MGYGFMAWSPRPSSYRLWRPGYGLDLTGSGLRRGDRQLVPSAVCGCGAVGALVVVVCLVVGGLGGLARAQPSHAPLVSGDRFAGLEWTFVRVRYNSRPESLLQFRRTYWSDPWAIDAPAAEQNLSRRLRIVTAIQVKAPIALPLDAPQLWEYPWIYFVEPGNLRFREDEVSIMREFLLRGGTATFDDFHGPIEWDIFEREIKRVFPNKPIVDLTPDHPIFSCFYRLDEYPQIPGLGSFFNGMTWEKGGLVPRLRAVLDDNERAMMLINWNTDMGDGWEWSNAQAYPGYIKYTAQAYRMVINEIIYALTH